MGLPSKKSTKTGKKRRLALLKYKKTHLSTCPKCKKPVLPHQACFFCGTYRGREVITIKFKAKDSKKKKEEEKEKKK